MTKKTIFALLCAFILPSFLLAQDEEKSIQLKTDLTFGESFSFVVNPTEGVSNINVDWGDGNRESYNISHDAMTFFRKVSGSVKGETITIYGDLEELDASGLKITAFKANEQSNLKILNLSDNSLTRENLILAGIPKVENLNLAKNNLTLLDVHDLKSLIYLSASNNSSLGSVLLPQESTSLKQITLDHCDISSFNPTSLPALTLLNLSNNALIDLEMGDRFPLLTELSLASNYISKINLAGVPLLANLDLSKNQIESLNLTPLKELVTLYLQDNKLKSIDLTNNTNLTRLNIANNQIAVLNTLPHGRLIDLDCSHNNIAQLDLTNNTFLKALRAAYNKLSFLNLSTNTNLGHVDIRHNPKMTPCSINFMFSTMWDCKGKAYSANLLIEGCNAENADPSIVTSPDYKWKPDITFSSTPAACNQLTFTLVNDASKGEVLLKAYDAGSNVYADIINKVDSGTPILAEVKPHKGFFFAGIKCNGELLPTNPFIISEEGTTLEVVWKEQNELTLGTVVDQPLSFALTLAESGTVAVDWGNGEEVIYNLEAGIAKRLDHVALGDHIRISGDLLAADFSSYPGMGTWDNAFSSISIIGLSTMEELLLYMNPIRELSIASLPNLKVLDCAFTGLEKLSVNSNKALTKLVCYGNKLTHLDLSENKLLEELECRNNQLSALDLSQNIKLTLLDAQSNLLETLDIAPLTMLEVLRLAGNKLVSLPLATNTKIKDLILSNNKLSSLETSNLSDLRLLYIDRNDIKTIDLSKNEKLVYLNCANNGMNACQLNDLFATLPKYPSKVDIKLSDNVTLRLTDNDKEKRNKAEEAETVLATMQGWKPNVSGDGSGCDEAYLFVVPSTDGVLSLYDNDGKELASGSKIKKGSQVQIRSKANDGWKLDVIKLNGVATDQQSFQVEKATWVQALFTTASALVKQSQLFAQHGRLLSISSAVVGVVLYNPCGEEVFAQNGGSEVELPSLLSEGYYLLLLQTASGTVTYKIYLP